jgi:hypothetical protein
MSFSHQPDSKSSQNSLRESKLLLARQKLEELNRENQVWMQRDKADYIKSLYSEYRTKFPKISKNLGFSQLSSIDLKNIPWPLYVMILTKQLNPLAYPEWADENDNRIKTCCDICDIHFVPDAKDNRGECAIRKVDGLYKLHKSTSKFSDYEVCSACYYALQNPQIMSDYPVSGRLSNYEPEYYIQSFMIRKRKSDFGYHGKLIVEKEVFEVLDVALLKENGELLEELDMVEYSR